MLKKLLNKLIGDFPPKWVTLCEKCRTAYTVSGLFVNRPPYKELVSMLYECALLCDEPCYSGVDPGTLPLQSPIGHQSQLLFIREMDITCERCRTALLTMMAFTDIVNDYESIANTLHSKDLVCQECLLKFIKYYQNNSP